MLTRLLPDQISSFWDVIKFAIEESLPPIVGESYDKMNRILAAAISGKIDVWAAHSKHDGVSRLEGILLTKFLYDDASNTKNMLIYCIYSYTKISGKSWLYGLDKLAKYAKSRGCSQIVAYTDVQYIIDLVNRLGGDTRYTFISFDVNKIVQKLNGLEE